MRSLPKLLSLGVAIGFTAIAPAHALTIDFESVPSGACASAGTVDTQGYTFTGNPLGQGIFVCNGNVNSQDPSIGLVDANAQAIITMTQDGGGAFSLDSFDAGSRTADFNVTQPSSGQGALQVLVTGNLQGGGTVSDLINFNGLLFQTFLLPGTFTNLTSVTFTGLGGSSDPEIALDNVVVDATPAPEPASLMLVGAGLAGLAAARRRRA